MQPVIRHIDHTAPEYATGVWQLREDVLRIPLGLSLRNEDLSRDKINEIFIAEADGRVIGCVFMQPMDAASIQLRAMAVYPEWQGRGVGALLVAAAEEWSRTAGYQRIELHARKVAMGFYLAIGYQSFGDQFTEVGIPHFMMEKSL
jgi:N-acetylglutamate synthase-like GNAT family acetyltransferase